MEYFSLGGIREVPEIYVYFQRANDSTVELFSICNMLQFSTTMNLFVILQWHNNETLTYFLTILNSRLSTILIVDVAIPDLYPNSTNKEILSSN